MRIARPIYQVPYAVDIISKNTIQRGKIGLSLDESLRSIPGLFVSDRTNLSQGDRISIRGIGSRAPFGVRGLKIILDGIPLTFADGQSQLNNLDLGSVQSIEVLRGPSSSLYGNAAGGVVFIKSQLTSENDFLIQPKFITGSHGLQKWQAKLSGRIGKTEYLVNFNKLLLDGFREHSAAKSNSINAIGRHQISPRTQLTVLFNYFNAPYQLNPSSLSRSQVEESSAATRFFVKSQGAGKEIKQGQAGVTFNYTDNEANQFEATVYGVSRSLFNPIPGRIIDLDRNAGGVRAVFGRKFKFDKVTIRSLLGADYEFQADDRLEFDNEGISSEQVGQAANDEILNLITVRHKAVGSKRAGLRHWSIRAIRNNFCHEIHRNSWRAIRPVSI